MKIKQALYDYKQTVHILINFTDGNVKSNAVKPQKFINCTYGRSSVKSKGKQYTAAKKEIRCLGSRDSFL